jgi:uncharacterized small protein (DUF1192 family)
MIKNTKQDWTAGKTVKVGFLALVVLAAVPTPGDFMPDAYLLVNKESTKLYKFVPHNGLTSIGIDEANEMIADAKKETDRIAAQVIAKAAAVSVINSLVV